MVLGKVEECRSRIFVILFCDWGIVSIFLNVKCAWKASWRARSCWLVGGAVLICNVPACF